MLVGVAVSASTTAFPVRGATPAWDTSLYAYVGWMVTRGHMPYTDAWDNKGPLTYLLYAVGTWMNPDHGMLAVSVVNLVVVGVLGYRLALLLTRPTVAGAVVGVALGMLVFVPELTEPLSLGFLGYLTLLATRVLVRGVRPTALQAVLAGGCVAASTLIRANNVLVLVPLGVVVVVQLARRAPAVAARVLGWLTVGVVAVTAPVAGWLWSGGALGAGLDAAYLGSMRWDRPLGTRVAETLRLVVGNGVAPVVVWVALAVLTVRRAGRAADPGVRRLSAAAVGGLGVFVVANVAGTGNKYAHYLMVLFPLTLVATLVVLGSAADWLAARAARRSVGTASDDPPDEAPAPEALPDADPAPDPEDRLAAPGIRPALTRRGTAVLVGAAVVLLSLHLPVLVRHMTTPYTTGLGSTPYPTTHQLVTYVQQHTDPDDKVLVLDFSVFGAQLRRESPTPYYRPDPPWRQSAQDEIWREIAADVLAAPPALIVFGDDAQRERFLAALPTGTRAAVQALLAGYQKVPPIGRYVIYQAPAR